MSFFMPIATPGDGEFARYSTDIAKKVEDYGISGFETSGRGLELVRSNSRPCVNRMVVSLCFAYEPDLCRMLSRASPGGFPVLQR